eukprot:14680372-Alexandrium_andersonii.AAC.1
MAACNQARTPPGACLPVRGVVRYTRYDVAATRHGQRRLRSARGRARVRHAARRGVCCATR